MNATEVHHPIHPRFAGRISVSGESGCWDWQLRLDKRGYGRINHSGKSGAAAHRVSYELHIGPIAEGMTVDHMCFNTACVNPQHLQLLSLSENAGRRRAGFSSHCPSGHAFNEENTYTKPPAVKRSRRGCRKCNLAAATRYRQRRQERQLTKEQAA